MLGALEAPRGALVVMDRGVATEDRIQWLREEGYRLWWPDPGSSELALTLETASKARLQLQEVSEDGGEVRLYCRSEERAHKERGIVERFSRRFEQGLARLSEGLSRPRAHKGIEKVRERIGRLKEQSRGVAQHYTIEVLRRERPQGDGPELEASAPPGLDGGRLLPAQQPDRGTRRACGAPTPL